MKESPCIGVQHQLAGLHSHYILEAKGRDTYCDGISSHCAPKSIEEKVVFLNLSSKEGGLSGTGKWGQQAQKNKKIKNCQLGGGLWKKRNFVFDLKQLGDALQTCLHFLFGGNGDFWWVLGTRQCGTDCE